jgi:Cdc6-like AAA superfamily ATPase
MLPYYHLQSSLKNHPSHSWKNATAQTSLSDTKGECVNVEVSTSSWHPRVEVTMSLSSPSTPFYKILVPTVDTLRYDYLVHTLILAERPVLMVGPVGTGKTSVAQGVLQRLNPAVFNILTVNLSAQVCIWVLTERNCSFYWMVQIYFHSNGESWQFNLSCSSSLHR